MTATTQIRPLWHRWLPAATWAVVIFVGSSLPGSAVPGNLSAFGHLGEYAVLAILASWAERHRGPMKAAMIALAFVALYGASDELHQLFVPMRMADPVDWLTDIAGACIGVTLLRLSRQYSRPGGKRVLR